jgi:magnesium chelatase accessory protein
MAKWDLATLFADMARCPVPVCLLVGENDATIAPAGAWRMAARLPGARVVRVAGLGHLAHEEDPAGIAGVIESLLPTAPAGQWMHAGDAA